MASAPPTLRVKEINILLLGETGVGKSTFINSFANYVTFNSMEDVERGELITLIPSSFTITDANFEDQEIKIGNQEDANECMTKGQSATQSCRCHEFPFEDQDGEHMVRLIDTPGIGDTKGITRDKENLKNILAFISQFDYLHAICILLKPNSDKLSASFEFCLKQYLSSLDKSASSNLLFVFSHSRSTFYKPGDTIRPLRQLLSNLKNSPPYVEVPFDRENTFCLDNEAFRFLVAAENGIHFTPEEKTEFGQSWINSAQECHRLMKRVLGGPSSAGLVPHFVQDTIVVNDARRLISDLAVPLVEVARNIQVNLRGLVLKDTEIRENAHHLDGLRERLYLPIYDVDYRPLLEPRTVCANPKCCEVYRVGDIIQHHYSQICHSPCTLDSVRNDVLGAPDGCVVFGGPKNLCKNCGCPSSCHLHVYYESRVVVKKAMNHVVHENLTRNEDIHVQMEAHRMDLYKRCHVLNEEMATLTQTAALFHHFLRSNAMASYNDSFKAYLEHVIEDEKSLLEFGSNNVEIINGLVNMLKKYEKAKFVLELNQREMGEEPLIDSKGVLTLIDRLCALPVSGPNIRASQTVQETAKITERQSQGETWAKPAPKPRNAKPSAPIIKSSASSQREEDSTEKESAKNRMYLSLGEFSITSGAPPPPGYGPRKVQEEAGYRVQPDVHAETGRSNNGHRAASSRQRAPDVPAAKVPQSSKKRAPDVPVAKIPQSPAVSRTKLDTIDFVSIHADNGDFLLVDPNITSVVGYTSEELIGTRCFDYCHPEDRANLIESVQKALSANMVFSTPYRFRIKSGKYVELKTKWMVCKSQVNNDEQLMASNVYTVPNENVEPEIDYNLVRAEDPSSKSQPKERMSHENEAAGDSAAPGAVGCVPEIVRSAEHDSVHRPSSSAPCDPKAETDDSKSLPKKLVAVAQKLMDVYSHEKSKIRLQDSEYRAPATSDLKDSEACAEETQKQKEKENHWDARKLLAITRVNKSAHGAGDLLVVYSLILGDEELEEAPVYIHALDQFLNELQTLREAELESLLEDLQSFVKWDQKRNSGYWYNLLSIVEDEWSKINDYGKCPRELVQSSGSDLIKRMKGKSATKLNDLKLEFEQIVQTTPANMEREYYAMMLSKLKATIARNRLREQNDELVQKIAKRRAELGAGQDKSRKKEGAKKSKETSKGGPAPDREKDADQDEKRNKKETDGKGKKKGREEPQTQLKTSVVAGAQSEAYNRRRDDEDDPKKPYSSPRESQV